MYKRKSYLQKHIASKHDPNQTKKILRASKNTTIPVTLPSFTPPYNVPKTLSITSVTKTLKETGKSNKVIENEHEKSPTVDNIPKDLSTTTVTKTVPIEEPTNEAEKESRSQQKW